MFKCYPAGQLFSLNVVSEAHMLPMILIYDSFGWHKAFAVCDVVRIMANMLTKWILNIYHKYKINITIITAVIVYQ